MQDPYDDTRDDEEGGHSNPEGEEYGYRDDDKVNHANDIDGSEDDA